MNKNELEKTFVEVRKAYRLIYLYQRRVLDIIDFISSKLPINPPTGWSKFSGSVKNEKKVKLKGWAWDWITLYLYDFHFGELKKEIRFSIILQSDSGFFESNAKDKLDIANFRNTEESQTKLFFVVAKNDWGCPIEKLLKDHLNSKTEFIKKIEPDKLWIAKSYSLSEFINEDSTINKINDFIEFCKNQGIKISEEIKVKKAE